MKEKKAISIKEVAKAAGVSEATVSLALNGSPLVKGLTKERVKKIAKEMGYVPNAMARGLAMQRSNVLGLVIPDIENVFYASLVRHLNVFARKKGYGLSISISNNEPEEEKRILEEMIVNRMEGVFVVPLNVPNPDPSYLNRLQEAAVPYVFCGDYYEGFPAPRILSDLEGGMQEMVNRALAQGHRHIWYLTGQPGVSSLDLREHGFLKAMRAAGFQDAESRIFRVDRVDYPHACRAAQMLLEKGVEADAVLCVNDMMAIGVVNTLEQAGRNVPKAIAVGGFDDMIFAAVSTVALTTVRQDIEAIAQKSVERLLRRISEEDQEADEQLIAGGLICRKSL